MLDPRGIVLSAQPEDEGRPAVTSNGTNYLVAWEKNPTGFASIYGARISAAGIVLDERPILVAADPAGHVALASDHRDYFLVWQDGRNGPVSNYDVFGAHLRNDGILVETNGFRISAGPGDEAFPSVAFGGTNYLVVWSDSREIDSLKMDVYGARVTLDGLVLDPEGIPIYRGTNWQWFAKVAFDGENYLVVWEDSRDFGAYDIYGARVGPSGELLDSGDFPINTSAFPQEFPSVCSGNSGSVLVLYQSFRPNPYGAVRAVGNLIRFIGPALTIDTGSDGHPHLIWNARIGKTYRVEFRPDAMLGSWVGLPGDVTALTATVEKTDDTIGSDSRRFYRLRELP